MKRIMLLVIIGLATAAWYRSSSHHPVRPGPVRSEVQAAFRHERPPAPPNDFHCDGRRYCSQMRSRAEAEYFLRHCPGTRMDGDHDGVPCENDSRF